MLASKGFIAVLNDDLVTYILDWNRNNLIKKDRYHPSVYQDLLVKIIDGTQLEPERNHVGTRGKVRLGKDSKSTEEPPAASTPTPSSNCSDKPAKNKYGAFGWVKLTNKEYIRLLNDFGEIEVKRCITYVDESAQSNGNKNKWRDWNLVIRRCHREGWGLKMGQNVQTARNNGGTERWSRLE